MVEGVVVLSSGILRSSFVSSCGVVWLFCCSEESMDALFLVVAG